jgi:hypothetical protein
MYCSTEVISITESIRVGREGLPGTNALAYSVIDDVFFKQNKEKQKIRNPLKIIPFLFLLLFEVTSEPKVIKNFLWS